MAPALGNIPRSAGWKRIGGRMEWDGRFNTEERETVDHGWLDEAEKRKEKEKEKYSIMYICRGLGGLGG